MSPCSTLYTRFETAFVCILAFILFSCNSVSSTTEPGLTPDSITFAPPPSYPTEEIGQPLPTAQIPEGVAIAPTVDISTMNISLKQELYFAWAAEGGPFSEPCVDELFGEYDLPYESELEFLANGTVPPELKAPVSPFLRAIVHNGIELCIFGFPEDEVISVEFYTPENTLRVSEEIRVDDHYYRTVGDVTVVPSGMDWPLGSQAGQWTVVVRSAGVNLRESIWVNQYEITTLRASILCDSPDGYISVQGVGYPPGEPRLLGVYGTCSSGDYDDKYASICSLLERYLIKIGDDGSFYVLLPSNLSGEYIVVPITEDEPPDDGGVESYEGYGLSPGVIYYPETCGYRRELYLSTPILRGGDVRSAQQRLVELGYGEIDEVNGYYGTESESAVLQFQKMNELSENGRVDEQTWNAIFSNEARPAAISTPESPADSSAPPMCTTTGATWTRSTDEMTLVCVPGGTFQMGSTDAEVNDAWELCNQVYGNCQRAWFEREQPVHAVTLDGFWIDRTEITQEQYAQCVASGMCAPSTYAGDANFNGKQQPVVGVDWHNAAAYCAWVGGQLPTEAQWEYAARGPESYVYPWGNFLGGTKLNYCDKNCTERWADKGVNDGYAYPASAGSYSEGKSWVGALNMAGNVMEWTADRYGSYSSEAQTNPEGPATGDTWVGRGGSWHGMAPSLRSSYRNGYEPTLTNDNLGFRCVVVADQGQ